MTKRIAPARAGHRRWGWVACAVVLLLPGSAGARNWRPDLEASLGGGFAVLGTPNEGGPSASLSALWPVADRFSFGVMLHADDAGSQVDSLRDAQGHGLPYGKIEQLHRDAMGASWRGDVRFPARFGVTPALSATWGLYRIRDDVHGTKLRDIGTSGFSVAALARRGFGRHLSMGVSARFHGLFNDFERRFATVSLEGAWH